MKILYFGGQKSGKSSLAEKKAIELSSIKKPYYIATYNNNYGDDEMKERVKKHQQKRTDNFTTIEEPFNLQQPIKENETYLIDCLSMWILNNLDKEEDDLIKQIDQLFKIEANIVFVLNEVTSGVIPIWDIWEIAILIWDQQKKVLAN